MPRKLKVFQTSMGFFDLAIAVPSMKAALEAWEVNSNLFHQGTAKESHDPAVVAATMSKPGVLLKRSVGSNGPFKETAELPKYLPGDDVRKSNKKNAEPKKRYPIATTKSRREAAVPAAKGLLDKERARVAEATGKAQAALERGKHQHDKRAAAINAARKALQRRAQIEEARWEREEKKLKAALKRAQG